MKRTEMDMLGSIAYSRKETLEQSYQLALKYALSKGVYIECGVAAGAQIGAMALALSQVNSNKPIFGFDSFEGIPIAEAKDKQQPGIGYFEEQQGNIYFPGKEGELVSSGISNHSLEEVQNRLKESGVNYEHITWVKGWFQDTLPSFNLRNKTIAILRLDCDLYASAKVCLEKFLPSMMEGGTIILDDYFTCEGFRLACDEAFGERKNHIVNFHEVGYLTWK